MRGFAGLLTRIAARNSVAAFDACQPAVTSGRPIGGTELPKRRSKRKRALLRAPCHLSFVELGRITSGGATSASHGRRDTGRQFGWTAGGASTAERQKLDHRAVMRHIQTNRRPSTGGKSRSSTDLANNGSAFVTFPDVSRLLR